MQIPLLRIVDPNHNPMPFNDDWAIFSEFDEQYSLTQSQTDLRKIIVKLSGIMANPHLTDGERQEYLAFINLLGGIADMLLKANALSFRV